MSSWGPLPKLLNALHLNTFGGRSTWRPRLAILIDCDGVSPSDASAVLEYVPKLGRICILRTYGNFTGKSATAWTRVVRKYSAIARHMPSVAPGKNAADIVLSIDAVEMLLTHRVDSFVLVASDSDFTPLAHRIREGGKDVTGFGNRSTPESLRRACSAFHQIRDLPCAERSLQGSVALWSHLPRDAEARVVAALAELDCNDQAVALTSGRAPCLPTP